MRAIYHHLVLKDVRSPKLHISILDSIPIQQRKPILSALNLLRNHDSSKISMSNFDWLHKKKHKPALGNLSQSTQLSLDDFAAEVSTIQLVKFKETEVVFDTSLNNLTFQ